MLFKNLFLFKIWRIIYILIQIPTSIGLSVCEE